MTRPKKKARKIRPSPTEVLSTSELSLQSRSETSISFEEKEPAPLIAHTRKNHVPRERHRVIDPTVLSYQEYLAFNSKPYIAPSYPMFYSNADRRFNIDMQQSIYQKPYPTPRMNYSAPRTMNAFTKPKTPLTDLELRRMPTQVIKARISSLSSRY
jgi:hypothetical protein